MNILTRIAIGLLSKAGFFQDNKKVDRSILEQEKRKLLNDPEAVRFMAHIGRQRRIAAHAIACEGAYQAKINLAHKQKGKNTTDGIPARFLESVA